MDLGRTGVAGMLWLSSRGVGGCVGVLGGRGGGERELTEVGSLEVLHFVVGFLGFYFYCSFSIGSVR